MSALSLPVQVKELIPHRAGMCLLEEFEEYTPETACTHAVVRHGLFTGDDGSVDPIVLIEYLAQLCACQAGYRARFEGAAPKQGFLVGLQDFRFHRPVKTGDTIRLEMKREIEVGSVFHARCRVVLDGEEAADGLLKLFEQERARDLETENDLSGPKTLNEHKVIDALRSRIHDSEYDAAERSGLVRITFDPAFPAFEGHFPGYPILPGIVLLRSAVSAAELVYGSPLQIHGVDRAKFGRLVTPGDELEITVSGLPDSESRSTIDCRIKRDAETCVRCSIDVAVQAADDPENPRP